MRQLFIVLAFNVAILATGCKLSGSAGIDTATGSPSTQPASVLPVIDKVASVTHDVVTNPAIVAATSPVPFANLVLGIIGTLTGVYATWRHLSTGPPITPAVAVP
jgi:hypothetical protein